MQIYKNCGIQTALLRKNRGLQPAIFMKYRGTDSAVVKRRTRRAIATCRGKAMPNTLQT